MNYQNGLVWSRNPQFRFIVHPNDKVAMGLSLENPEQYIGGSGGGGLVTLPAALATPYANQLNNGNTTLSVPDVHPDIIAKVALDPSSRAHVEVAGVFRTFKVYNPLNTTHYTANGFGGSANVNFELANGFRVLSNNYWSDGGGRWIFGLAPDLVVRPDGSLSALHAASTVDGVELQVKKTLFYAYYGGTFIGKNAVVDATGKYVGYGYPGSAQQPEQAYSRTDVRTYADVLERPEIWRLAVDAAVLVFASLPLGRSYWRAQKMLTPAWFSSTCGTCCPALHPRPTFRRCL